MDDEQPSQWDKYARIQDRLAKTNVVDDKTFGIEAALDRLASARSADGIERCEASAGRRERNRARVTRTRVFYEIKDARIVEAIDAQLVLDRLRGEVSPDDWDLLTSVAHGRPYGAIADETGQDVGAVRVRVHRLRVRLRPVAAPVLDELCEAA